MNIYIMQKNLDIFLKKLKENDNIDDFILDKAHFGKHRIRIFSTKDDHTLIESLVPILPVNSIIVSSVQNPGKEYLFCVGEVPTSKLSFFENNKLELAVLTIKKDKVRFNSWIHLSKLEELYNTSIIENFSSMSGKIENYCYFVFETNHDAVQSFHEILSFISDEFIIKENKIYVKLLLQDFTSHFVQLKKYYTYVQIVDR